MQTLRLLRGLLDKAPPPKPPAASPPADDIPAPPAFYAKPSYIPGFAFQGRVKELAALRDWAGSADNLMLVDAIGGMGKSMAAWEWVTKHAARERPDWAGRLWYSFYERGATMHDFCVTALAYMTRCPRKSFANEPTHLLVDQLMGALHAKPWLLVLDGLGRVLVAYHRSDAAQIPDAEVEPGTDNSCIRPDDEDLLRQLCAAAPSKILATSRLTPRAWLNPAAQPLPGVRRWQLVGLDPRDAEALMMASGVVAGVAFKDLRALGDFDIWVDEPDGGAAVDLTDPDIRPRKTHIRKQAFDDLDQLARELMARLAIISSAVDREVLEAMNPARPPPPGEVEDPSTLNLDADFRAQSWRIQLTEVKTQDERVSLEKRIFQREEQLRAELETAKQAYVQYRADLDAWRNSDVVRSAGRKLNEMARNLEQRGLLQCDRRSGHFDLHPVVRGHAVQSLGGQARAETGQRVADYFSSRADTPYAHASSLPDLQDGIPVVQALSLAGKTEEAWRALRSDLGSALFRLELHHEWLALFRAFFPAKYTKLSCAPASSPLNWRTRMRIPILLAFVALALSGCNHQAINPSGEANLCAHDPSCNPYNPSSYAQNNVGIGR